jgi:hypothetical protein
MTNHFPTDEEFAALSEPEFLALDRDVAQIDAKGDFQRAGIHTLGALCWGGLALAGNPYGALVSCLMAGVGGYYLWNGIQDIGKGVQDAAKASAADTALRILSAHDAAELPSPLVRDAEPAGRVQPLAQSLGLRSR